ncbi:MAG: hypothetical protein XD94_1591 [Mesotoga prima]|uniref:Uncharacterized protein n=1 Tax=Mesotoga prima TaxID=1184387 RepID=A0A101HM42_9BACT|nr:MAG: hypothetical protein XD94_1591 [Mesotoga prima]
MMHCGDKYGEQKRTRFGRERMRTGNCEITRGVRIERGEERVSGVASRFAKARSRAGTLNRCTSGHALRDDALFLLHVILARFRPGSRSLKQLQVPRCKL